MTKLPYNDLIKSMSMFFLDEDVDCRFIQKRDKYITLADEMSSINSRDGLENYIRKNTDSLDKLLIILGISGEYFKRITSLFRIQQGMTFKTEWSISSFRNFILDDRIMMDKTLTLFTEADSNKVLASFIPKYRLSSFKISEAVMKRLGNSDFLRVLFSKELDTSFNNAMTSSKVRILETILFNICNDNGFTINKTVSIDVTGNNTRTIPINYTITRPNCGLPSYYIAYSFYLTTSKGQTGLKNNVKNIRDYIRNNNPKAKLISVVDGAGWVGRQADLKDIWDYSTHCLNLAHIDELNNIII